MVDVTECERCGSHLPDGSLKCLICGHLSGRLCDGCGGQVPSGERMCETCGYDLGPELKMSDLSDDGRVRIAMGRLTSDTTPMDTADDEAGREEGATEPEPPPVPEAIVDVAASTNRETKPLPDPGDAATVPPPPLPEEAKPGQDVSGERAPEKIRVDDYHRIMLTCEELIKARYDLYGVFGRPEAGKTCFIYSLGRVIKGISGMEVDTGSYTLDRNWNDLINYQERLFDQGQEIATAKGLHFYKANAIGRFNRKRHFALIDIRGEQFEQIDDWNKEITDFFLTYLSHCKGIFLFLDLDADAVARSRGEVFERRERELGRPLTEEEKEQYGQAYAFKRNQMSHMVSFLSVAATIPKMLTMENFFEQRSAMSHASREAEVGSRQVEIPVSLCISKADLVKDRRYDGYPAIVPGSDDYYGDPWNAVETFFKNDLDNMKKLAPNLKVEWVSSTGDNFDPKRGIGRPMGVASVFNHVVAKPMPKWAMSSRAYAKWRKFLMV